MIFRSAYQSIAAFTHHHRTFTAFALKKNVQLFIEKPRERKKIKKKMLAGIFFFLADFT